MKKKIIIIILSIILIILLLVLYLYKEETISVLGYHNIYDQKEESNNNNEFIIEKNNFEKQMKYLSKNHYRTLSLEEFSCWKKGKCKYGRKTVLITFDDGYYYNYKYAFSILKKYNQKAVVFFVGSSLSKDNTKDSSISSYLSMDTIKASQKEYPNIEFASHTYNLHSWDTDINKLIKKEIDDDIKKFNNLYQTKYIAYPGGSYNDTFIEALKENGYLLAFGFKQDEHRKAKRSDNDYDVPRLNISSNMPLWKFKLRINMPK